MGHSRWKVFLESHPLPQTGLDGHLSCSPGTDGCAGRLVWLSCLFSRRLREGAISLLLKHGRCLINITWLIRDNMYVFLLCTRH